MSYEFKISVVIPTYNRACIYTCLKAIYSQKDAPSFEVIVAARDPNIHYRQNFERLRDVYPSLRLHATSTAGNGPAKNEAVVLLAKGEFIVFTDDDCIVSETWLKELYLAQWDTGADIVSGQCLPSDNASVWLLAHQGHIMYHLDTNHRWTRYAPYRRATIGTTMNLMVRQVTFCQLGMFGDTFQKQYGDDYDFNQRWSYDPMVKAVYNPGAIVKHNHPMSLKRLLKVSFRYGMGLYHCSQIGHYSAVCMFRKDYGKMLDYISFLSDHGTVKAHVAAILAVLMQEVKRLGSWYAKRHPAAPSKIYD